MVAGILSIAAGGLLGLALQFIPLLTRNGCVPGGGHLGYDFGILLDDAHGPPALERFNVRDAKPRCQWKMCL